MTCEGQSYSFTTSCKVDASNLFTEGETLVRQRT